MALGLKKSGVRRCLFGVPDHEQIRKDLDRALLDMKNNTKSQLRMKWDFDEDTGRSIEGRLDWKETNETEYVPEFYKKGYSTRTKRVCRSDRGTQMDTTVSSAQSVQGLASPALRPDALVIGVRQLDFTSNGVSTRSSPPTNSHSRNQRTQTSPPRQSTITDHFQPRKRRLDQVIETTQTRSRACKSPRI